MIATMIKVIILLSFIIIPLRGPLTKRKESYSIVPDKYITYSNYGVNQYGELEEINSEKNKEA